MNALDLQSNEILDVVDSDDKVVGHATRGQIHKEGWLHRAVHVFLFNSTGEIYIQRRSSLKDRHPSKLDSSAAGHVDSMENYEEAAKRELNEELGITGKLRPVLKVSACAETDNEHVVLFSVRSDATPVPDPKEIASGKFIDPPTLTQLMAKHPEDFVPAFILLWGLYGEINLQ
ncbi:MAG: NUDIX hydrolase [Desulfomonilaceae bacterium]